MANTLCSCLLINNGSYFSFRCCKCSVSLNIDSLFILLSLHLMTIFLLEESFWPFSRPVWEPGPSTSAPRCCLAGWQICLQAGPQPYRRRYLIAAGSWLQRLNPSPASSRGEFETICPSPFPSCPSGTRHPGSPSLLRLRGKGRPNQPRAHRAPWAPRGGSPPRMSAPASASD